MEAHSLSEALKMIMRQRKCTQTDLGRELGRSQDWVSAVILGKRDPRFMSATMRLARVGWEVVIRPKNLKRETDPVKRREFHDKIFKLAGGTVAGKIAGIPLAPSDKLPPFRNPDYVTALADHILNMRNELGGARLIANARAYVERVNTAEIIAGGDRPLQIAAAKLVRAQAFTYYDANRQGPAEATANHALAFAQASGHPETRALMHITLSQVATAAGAGDRAHHYAQEGLKISGINDGYRAELLKRKMRALAILPGQESPALRAYEEIRNLDELTFTFFNATEPHLSAHLGWALSDLGRHRDASNSFAQAGSRYADWNNPTPFFYAQTLAGEIKSQLRGQMPDVAADRMMTLAHILPLTNSAQLNKDISNIIAASAPWTAMPGMRDARDQLRTAIAT